MTAFQPPSLKGYRIFSKICEGSTTIVYRGQRQLDRQSVVIKFLKNPAPQIEDLERIRNQYFITNNLDSDRLIKTYSLENYGRSFALVMEDYDGISLLETLNNQNQLNLTDFLKIAIEITNILEQLAQNRIIHQNITPQHLLINLQSKKIKLISFSIASLLPKINQFNYKFTTDQSLAYISPEQTRKTNRSIDYRTDFYSVGIIFYQLLTKKLPFQERDLHKLIHAHLAKIPPHPKIINPNLPSTINNLVLKLLAKNPEDRYQTAFGLRSDLELCQQQWQTNQNISDFSLAQKDISDRFSIPEKVYGRESEIKTLNSTFTRIIQGKTELILVSGYSGVGKTALINEIHKPISKYGYFIEGKFDQFQRNIPFLGLSQAFRNLINLLLTENKTSLQRWQTKLTKALRENAQLIIDLIPELEQIIGIQLAIVELEPSAAEKRFNLVFKDFIEVFTTSEYPLVIFLDDLQWADLASLKLIELLSIINNNSGLLIIGAYRDNEVDLAHPLMVSIANIKEQNSLQVQEIKLSPLSFVALNHLIADTLFCSKSLAFSLTELVYQKTQGNPFFSIQLLLSFYQTNLITFNSFNKCWQCDLAKIKLLAISNDVIKFLIERLQKLSTATQDILKLAACLGNQFDLTTLAIIYNNNTKRVKSDRYYLELTKNLWEALQAELILPISEIYQFCFRPEKQKDTFNFNNEQQFNLSVSYQFLHDHVQQAAYLLIPKTQLATTHLEIGNLLLKNLSPEAKTKKIFTIVDHLNLGRELINQSSQKKQLAQLNFQAGTKAKQTVAYSLAFNYFTTGIELLDSDCWQQDYDFTLHLFLATAEIAYLCGQFEPMEKLFNQMVQQVDDLLDLVRVYEIKIKALIAQGKPAEAVKIALKTLNQLGINFPIKPNKLIILISLIKTKLNLLGLKIENLIYLPTINNSKILVAGRIMMIVGSSAYSAAVEIIPLITLSGVNLSIRYGNAPISTFGYAGFGIILCGFLDDIDSGYRFGKLALDLVEKLNAKEQKARTMMLFNNFIRHWKEHLSLGLESLLAGYQIGLENGDLEFAAYSAYMYCYHSYFVGKELTQLDQKMKIYGEAINNLKQQTVLRLHQVYHQVVLNLLGQNQYPCLLIGEVYNENNNLALLIQENHRSALFDLHFHKAMLLYLFENFGQAFQHIIITKKYLDSAIATPSIPIFYFYDALIHLAKFPETTKSQKRKILNHVNKNLKKLRKWSRYCSANISHKIYLILAEKKRVLGDNYQAIEYYELAIELSQEQEYLNEQALAQELAAKFYLAWGKTKIAQLYFTDAYYSYVRWGAKAKVKDLIKKYPQLLTTIVNYSTVSNKHYQDFKQLDLNTVIKVYQAISKEIKLEQLLSTLIKVILENIGAQVGYLILPSQTGVESLLVSAKVIENKITIQTLSTNLITSKQQFPQTVINYVQNTLNPLIINDSKKEKLWINDSYFDNYQPQSILCLPILNHQRLVAILYLEHNLAPNAFNIENQAVLNIICSQAAISIENASLYHNLETLIAQEKEKTSQLELSLQELKQTQIKLLKIQSQLKYDAFHDSLTGLSNRQWLVKLLQRAINLSARYPNYLYALLFLDLDGFKQVNDRLGHLMGDRLLQLVSNILQSCVRASDTVARFGGDEFAILLEELESPQEAIAIAQRIQNQFVQPITLDSHQLKIGTSIGITYGIFDYLQPEQILNDADTAMYQAKALGKGRYVVFQLDSSKHLSSS